MGQRTEPNLWVDISRVDDEARMVFGYATTEAVDSYGTVIDLGSVEACLPDYLKWRNIREMHQPSAVGTADEVTLDDKGLYVGAHIVDDQAWIKVKEGVYKGFSIGGKKDYQVGNRIYLKKINEITLGDRPSNEECTFDTFRIYQKEDSSMDENAPETGAVEETANADVKRYAGEEISDARTALSAVQEIMWLLQYEQAEMTNGAPEAPEQVALLRAAIENLKKFIVSEIQEDNSTVTLPAAVAVEVLGEVAMVEECRNEDENDVERIGSRNSKKDKQDLQTIHDAVTRLGASCGDADRVNSESDVFRVEGYDKDIHGLDGAREEIVVLVNRLRELESQPEPSKGAAKIVAVTKEQDNSTVTRTEENEIAPPASPLEAIQRIHQAGGNRIERL